MNMRHRPQADTPKLPRELSGEPVDQDKVVPIAAPPPPSQAVADESKCREKWDNGGRFFGVDLASPGSLAREMRKQIERHRAADRHSDLLIGQWGFGDIEVIILDHRTGKRHHLGDLVSVDRTCHYTGPDEWTIRTRER